MNSQQDYLNINFEGIPYTVWSDRDKIYCDPNWGRLPDHCTCSESTGVGSVATCTLQWKVKIHQHLLNHSWLKFKICLLH